SALACVRRSTRRFSPVALRRLPSRQCSRRISAAWGFMLEQRRSISSARKTSVSSSSARRCASAARVSASRPAMFGVSDACCNFCLRLSSPALHQQRTDDLVRHIGCRNAVCSRRNGLLERGDFVHANVALREGLCKRAAKTRELRVIDRDGGGAPGGNRVRERYRCGALRLCRPRGCVGLRRKWVLRIADSVGVALEIPPPTPGSSAWLARTLGLH